MILLITSVRYADFLAVTLPAWREFLPGARICVVTAPDDRETAALAARAGAGLVRTTAWTANGATFDRAAALDVALEAAGAPELGEVCLSVDADVYPLGTFPPDPAILPDVLYGCPRFLIASSGELLDHLDGRTALEDLKLMDVRLGPEGYPLVPNTPTERHRTASACLGYFQCFRYAGQRFGSFPTTGGFDTAFAERFWRRGVLSSVYVLHLGPSAGRNWSGRTLPHWPPPRVAQEARP